MIQSGKCEDECGGGGGGFGGGVWKEQCKRERERKY